MLSADRSDLPQAPGPPASLRSSPGVPRNPRDSFTPARLRCRREHFTGSNYGVAINASAGRLESSPAGLLALHPRIGLDNVISNGEFCLLFAGALGLRMFVTSARGLFGGDACAFGGIISWMFFCCCLTKFSSRFLFELRHHEIFPSEQRQFSPEFSLCDVAIKQLGKADSAGGNEKKIEDTGQTGFPICGIKQCGKSRGTCRRTAGGLNECRGKEKKLREFRRSQHTACNG